MSRAHAAKGVLEVEQVFSYVPLSGGARATFIGLIGALLVLPALFCWMYAVIVNARVEIGPGGLEFRAPWYGRTIPVQALDLDRADVVSLAGRTRHALNGRTNGIGLPGLQVGWFRLASGERALAFVTSRDRVAYLPTREGYTLLLSLERPEELIAALRARRTE